MNYYKPALPAKFFPSGQPHRCGSQFWFCSYKPETASMMAFLSTNVHNRAVDIIRKYLRRRESFDEEIMADAPGDRVEKEAGYWYRQIHQSSPEYDSDEVSLVMSRAKKLASTGVKTKRNMQLLELYEQGHPVTEIARMVGESEATVKSFFARLMRDLIEDEKINSILPRSPLEARAATDLYQCA